MKIPASFNLPCKTGPIPLIFVRSSFSEAVAVPMVSKSTLLAAAAFYALISASLAANCASNSANLAFFSEMVASSSDPYGKPIAVNALSAVIYIS